LSYEEERSVIFDKILNILNNIENDNIPLTVPVIFDR